MRACELKISFGSQFAFGSGLDSVLSYSRSFASRLLQVRIANVLSGLC